MIAQTGKASFVLTGFRHSGEFRVFTFEYPVADKKRDRASVQVNLRLARQYGISIQELPLLCRGVAERGQEEDGDKKAFTLTEDEMRVHSEAVTAAREAARSKARARAHFGGKPATQ